MDQDVCVGDREEERVCVCELAVSFLFHQAEATTAHSFSDEPFKASKTFSLSPHPTQPKKKNIHLRVYGGLLGDKTLQGARGEITNYP